MFKKVDKSLFEGLAEIDPVKHFKIKYPKDEDAFAQAVWKDVIAYCKFGKRDQAYKVMVLDGDSLERKWFYMAPKQFGYLKRWNKHCEERLEKGASYRDAWDIHWWLAMAMPEALKFLRNDLHGYPTCAIDLWNKLAEITGDEKMDEAAISAEIAAKHGLKKKGKGKKAITVEDIRKSSDVKALIFDNDDDEFSSEIDKIRFETWKKALERLEFLFREYNDDTCSMKNPYKFEWHYDWKPCKDGKCREMVWAGTDEEKAEHDRYMDRAMEIDRYQSECLHKALKITEIFIEHLWD